jgi:hypothetical protein
MCGIKVISGNATLLILNARKKCASEISAPGFRINAPGNGGDESWLALSGKKERRFYGPYSAS